MTRSTGMTFRLRRNHIAWSALACLVLAAPLAACSAAAPSSAPTTAPTLGATVAPTPSAVPTAPPVTSPSASVVAATDPAAGLAIAEPFTLAPLDLELEAAFRQNLGTDANVLEFGGREAVRNGALAGYVFVFGFRDGSLTDGAFKDFLSGMKLQFDKTPISGIDVSTASDASQAYAIFRIGDHVVAVTTPLGTKPEEIATALIAANR